MFISCMQYNKCKQYMQHEHNQRIHRDSQLWSVCPQEPAPARPENQAIFFNGQNQKKY